MTSEVSREKPIDYSLMAHILIEYSANLSGRIDFPRFLEAVHASALATGIFPIGGVRTRAYAAEHYRIADGHPAS